MANQFSKTFSELREIVAKLCGDPSRDYLGGTEAVRAINEACLEFAMKTGAVLDSFTFPLEDGTWAYNVSELVAAAGGSRRYVDPIRVGQEANTLPPLTPTSQALIDQNGLHQAGPNVWGWARDLAPPKTIWIVGKPGATAPEVTITYRAEPVEMTNGNDYPDPCIQPQFHDALALCAAASLLLEEADDEKVALADLYQARFDAICRSGVGNVITIGLSAGGARPL